MQIVENNAPRSQKFTAPTAPAGLTPGTRPAGANAADAVKLSGERPESENVDHLSALRGNYGEPATNGQPTGAQPAGGQPAGGHAEAGPIELINPSAPVEKDCLEILAALGEAIPGDIDLATNVSAVPIGPGVLLGTTTASLEMNGEIPALKSLDAHIGEAQTSYRGVLPPKVARHVQLARAAAYKAGLS